MNQEKIDWDTPDEEPKTTRNYEPDETGSYLPMTDWRRKIRDALRAPTEPKLATFLSEIADHGRVGHALQAAGIAKSVVSSRVKDDEEFAQAYELAKGIFAARVEKIAFEQIQGVKETKVDKEGNASTRLVFPSNPLLQMLLKRVNKEYTEKKEIDMNVNTGGSLVVPRTNKKLTTEADWIEQNGKALPDSGTKTIETTATEKDKK